MKRERLFVLKILFICTGNTCRSPLAAALFNRAAATAELPFKVTASSAGLFALPGEKASAPVQQLLGLENIDISSHCSTSVDPALTEDADLILVMTAEHRRQLLLRYPHLSGKTFLLKEYAGELAGELDIDDPIGGGLEKYKHVLEDIRQAVKKILMKFGESEKI
jgi:protein arginine phosphatase